MALSSQLLGIDFGQGLLAAGLSRVLPIVSIIALRGILVPQLLKEVSKSRIAKIVGMIEENSEYNKRYVLE